MSTRADLLRQIAELEQTVARLENEALDKKRGGFTQFLRSFTISLLVLLCALSSAMSVSSIWVKRNIVNTDVWVEKTSQLIEDPAIRSSISTRITDQVFTQADVQGRLAEILPEQINGLSGPLTNNLKSAVNGKVNEALASKAFTDFWAKANQSAHQGIMDSLKNGGVATRAMKDANVMYVDNQHLVLNLRPVYAGLQDRLVERGLTFVGKVNIDKIGGEITIVTIKHMPELLMAINVINKTAFALPVLAIGFGAGAIALARNRRRTLMAIGWSIAALMVLLVQSINLIRYPLIRASLDALVATKTNAASAAYDIITTDLILISRTFLIMALLLVIAGFLSGSSRPAVFIKTKLGKLMRTNENQNTFVRWVRTNAGMLFATIGTIAALLLIFPLVRGTPVYPIAIVSIAVLLSFLVAIVKQGSVPQKQPSDHKNT